MSAVIEAKNINNEQRFFLESNYDEKDFIRIGDEVNNDAERKKIGSLADEIKQNIKKITMYDRYYCLYGHYKESKSEQIKKQICLYDNKDDEIKHISRNGTSAEKKQSKIVLDTRKELCKYYIILDNILNNLFKILNKIDNLLCKHRHWTMSNGAPRTEMKEFDLVKFNDYCGKWQTRFKAPVIDDQIHESNRFSHYPLSVLEKLSDSLTKFINSDLMENINRERKKMSDSITILEKIFTKHTLIDGSEYYSFDKQRTTERLWKWRSMLYLPTVITTIYLAISETFKQEITISMAIITAIIFAFDVALSIKAETFTYNKCCCWGVARFFGCVPAYRIGLDDNIKNSGDVYIKINKCCG